MSVGSSCRREVHERMELIWTALVLGAAGSVHCAGMCGPLALAIPVPEGGGWRYLLGRVFYNLGRVVMYGCLGAGFGLVGRTVYLAGFQQWFSLVLGTVLLLGLFLSPRLLALGFVTRWVTRLKRAMGGLLRRRGMVALGLLGLLNGLLPCGLVYVACAGAAATGGVVSGLVYMLVFGLGTVPVMLAISLSGRLFQAAMRRWMMRVVPVSVGLVAGLLILRGLGLGIPYVSPAFSPSTGAACCTEPAE